MSNPMDSEEDILFGGGPTSPVSMQTGGSTRADEDDNWAPLQNSPHDPLSAPRVEAAPAATAEPMMDQGAPVPPEKPRAPEHPKTVRVRAPRALPPAHVRGPRPRPPRLRTRLAPLIVAMSGIGAGVVMFLHFDNPPLAGVAVSLGVIGTLFTRVLLRVSR